MSYNITVKNIKRTMKKERNRKGVTTIIASMDLFVYPVAGTFHRSVFEELLAEKNCTHIKFYCGVDRKGKTNFEFVALNNEGEDLAE